MRRGPRLATSPRLALVHSQRRRRPPSSAIIISRKALELAEDPTPIHEHVQLLAQLDTRAIARRFNLKIKADLGSIATEAPLAGTVVPATALGMAVAYFTDDAHRSAVISKPDAEWAVIADTSFSLTSPNMLGPGLPEAGHRWPELSGIADAHLAKVRGGGAFVGIIDSGVDSDHAELSHASIRFLHVTGRAGSGRSVLREVRGFDTHGHGTLVSSVIAGARMGVAPGADLYVASVAEGDMLEAPLAKMVHGLDWIVRQFLREGRGTGILNISLGFPSEAPDAAAKPAYNQSLQALRLMLAECRAKGLLPIAPIGNEGRGRCDCPALFPEVLAVGAVDMETRPARFSGSNRGLPNCLGFGVKVPAASERDYQGASFYRDCSGTSFATAYVSGIGALYLSQNPQLTVDELQALLTQVHSMERGSARNVTRFVQKLAG